jgi:hypothetical protein
MNHWLIRVLERGLLSSHLTLVIWTCTLLYWRIPLHSMSHLYMWYFHTLYVASLLAKLGYIHTFALSGGGLGRRRECLYILRSAFLPTAGIGSLRTVLELSLRWGSLVGVPHGPSAWIPARYLDGSMALAWLIERPEHVCSQELNFFTHARFRTLRKNQLAS